MKPKIKLVWKLTAVVAVILAVAIAMAARTHDLIPLLTGIVAAWVLFGWVLDRPIRCLIAGTRQIADHQLDFRFDRKRHDEIGVLEESFNAMTATIQASQDELRDAKEYLEGIIENTADIIVIVNTMGVVEAFNRGGEETLGYRREEVIGRRIESLYVDARDRRSAAVRLEETGTVKNFATRVLAKDGQMRNVLLTLSYLRDSEGTIIGTIGISKDVTQEKQLQDELRDAKEYLEGVIEHSADIIIAADSDGLIEMFNRGAEEALGFRREEVLGTHIETLYLDPRERHAAAARLEDTDDVKNYETRLLAKDGRARNVLLTLSYRRDDEGKIIGTIGISKDITQEKRLERELIQSQKFAAIGQAATGIQHAIKNMLNALKGGAYVARRGMAKDNPEQVKEGWAMVDEGIERITSLSHNMLNFAREWKPDLEDVDLNDLIANVCELNRHTAADRGVALAAEPADDLPTVPCDSKLIHMAVTDLVVNAIDACTWKHYPPDETPKVVLSCAEDGDYLLIENRDNGCGMTEAVKKNIFAPFFSTKKTLGTGLGLAVTSRIIGMHGGKISVESEPDRGTMFRIHIPKDTSTLSKEMSDG